MPKVQLRIVEERFGEPVVLGFFIAGFVHAAFIKLVYGGARVANKHRRMGGYQELRPAAPVKLVYNRHKREYPRRRKGCFRLIKDINTRLKLVIK